MLRRNCIIRYTVYLEGVIEDGHAERVPSEELEKKWKGVVDSTLWSAHLVPNGEIMSCTFEANYNAKNGINYSSACSANGLLKAELQLVLYQSFGPIVCQF